MSTRVKRQFPFAVAGTALVIVAPALVAALLPGGLLVTVPACVALSLVISIAAGALWRRLPQSRDVLFSDLMLWGWLRRLRTELRLEHVESLVIFRGGPVEAIRSLRGLQRVTTMLENRDAYTRRHSHRVTRHCEGIARELGLPDDEIARVRTAAALHDIGKFFTPREVLNKPGRLSEEEFAAIKQHPGDGADMVAGVVEPAVESMIRHHHERLGGDGYPSGLKGDAIPLGARIIAVADTFDAITSTRAYRTARPHANALRVLREEAGTGLDARVVNAFLAYYSGRRATPWSSLASAIPHIAAPARELVFSGGRALPALGASAAVLVAPAVSARPAVDAPRATVKSATATVRAAVAPPRLTSSPSRTVRVGDVRGGTPSARARARARTRGAAPNARLRPGAPDRPGASTGPGVTGGSRPAGGGSGSGGSGSGGSGSGGGESGGQGGGSTGDPSSPGPANNLLVATPVPSAVPNPTSAPPVVPAPSAEPDVQVNPVTVTVGEIELQTPEVQLELPVDLPIKLPPIKLLP